MAFEKTNRQTLDWIDQQKKEKEKIFILGKKRKEKGLETFV
jgi:hypothetical protein